MRGRRQLTTALADPVLVGATLLIVALVGMYLSYNSSRGLPFVPAYRISAEVPDAAGLVKGSTEVRVGGSRVGLVEDVDAVEGHDGKPPYARLRLSLTKDVERLPVDSAVEVRPRSILGAKYLDIDPGRSRRGLLPGATLSLRHAHPAFEFDDAFKIFDSETRRGLRRTVGELGDGLAGRGGALNATLRSTRRLLPPLQRVTRVLASPRTELEGFLKGAAATTGALARVAPQLGSLIDTGATTLAALDAAGDSLGRGIEELPPTESVATRTLRRAIPVLDDAGALTRGLRSGTALLPEASTKLESALDTGIPVLRRLNAPYLVDGRRTRLVPQVERVVRALRKLAEDRATKPALSELIATVSTLRTTLRVAEPAQLQCNAGGLWARNVSQVVNGGDSTGYWLNSALIFDLNLVSQGTLARRPGQSFQSGAPDPELHVNPYPHADASECEAGNEPFLPGRQIGNPAGRQRSSTETTAPPAGVPDLARKAGLVP